MTAVYKYPLKATGPATTTILLPLGAKVISAAVQDGVPVIWAIVTPGHPQSERRSFLVAYTGNEVPTGAQFITTAFFGRLVVHVFEVPNG